MKSENFKRKEKDFEGPILPITPVARGFNQNNDNITVIQGNSRALPSRGAEEGSIMYCFSCGYQAPEQEFVDEDTGLFQGCPECGDLRKYVVKYLPKDSERQKNS